MEHSNDKDVVFPLTCIVQEGSLLQATAFPSQSPREMKASGEIPPSLPHPLSIGLPSAIVSRRKCRRFVVLSGEFYPVNSHTVGFIPGTYPHSKPLSPQPPGQKIRHSTPTASQRNLSSGVNRVVNTFQTDILWSSTVWIISQSVWYVMLIAQ